MSNHSDLVPCSKCGAPVLTNLAECMFCGQIDPGKVGATAIGRRWLTFKYDLLKRQRILTRRLRNIELPSWIQPLDDIGATTNLLIAICVALYIAALGFDAFSTTDTASNIITPSNEILARMGMAGRGAVLTGRFWGMLTAVYLHANLLHLLMNMIVLWRFGNSVENLFGRNQYFLIFTISGLSGTLFTTALGTFYSVGASGAIFGLLGALAYYWFQDGSEYGRAMMRQIGIFAILIFVMGATTPNVDNPGHLGGFLGGIGTAYLLRNSIYPASHPIYARAAQLCLALTLVAFLLSTIIPI